MYTITTATSTYTPDDTDVVHYTSASLTDRRQPMPVHLLQYDHTVPIIAVELTANGAPYTVPSGAAVNIRMDKPDGKHAYNPAKGLSSDRHTAYFEVTAQMTAAHGESSPAVEIVVNGGISGSGSFSLVIDKNPVPEDAYESDDEYKTIYQIANDVSVSAKIVNDNAVGIQYVQDNTATITAVAQNGTNVSTVGQAIANVNAVAESISDVQAAAENLQAIQQAPTAAANAAQSAQQAKRYAESVRPDELVQKSKLIDLVYPVGSIYMSTNNVSPASFLGGTWELIEDRFIRGADSNHAAGTTGGSWTHTQTKEEVGPHAHGIKGSTSTTANALAGGYLISNAETYDYWISGMETINSNGAQPMDITNPYFCAYILKRTA